MGLSVGKAFVACALGVLAASLSCVASAQYVDLEAERAAAQAAGGITSSSSSQPAGNGPALNDPYGARPAQAYPAASYGASRAPSAANAVTYASSAPAAATGNQSTGTDLRHLFLQMQQLEQEVRRLNGKVEEQSFELSSLKEQSLQRYMELDKRFNAANGQPDTAGVSATPTPAPSVATNSLAAGVEQPGEATAYRAAYALVQGRQFDKAIPAFQQFLQRFPDGLYAANAHYWLGELYLVREPPDLEASRQSFVLLLAEYPDNSKAPDALYKLGKVQFMKGNREKAREYMDLVISQYGSTNNAVVKLAREFIAQNY
jgi:tol-pal system protein YbgF